MGYVTRAAFTAVGIIFPVLAITALALRIDAWRRFHRKLGLDDLFIVPAGILTIAISVGIVVGAQMDVIGGHSKPENTGFTARTIGQFQYALWIGQPFTLALIKLSLLFFFRRTFKGQYYRTAFDWINWTLIVLTVVWAIVFLFFDIFYCGTNPSLAWSLKSVREKCLDTFSILLASSVFSFAMDLAILIEPLCMIGRLKMDKKRRIYVSLVFLMSSFAVIAGLLRLIPWIQLEIQGTKHPFVHLIGDTFVVSDIVGVVSIIIFWSYIELGVGFLVASLPPCVRQLDRISLTGVVARIRSFPSLSSMSRRSQRSSQDKTDRNRDEESRGASQTSHPPSLQPKQSKDSSSTRQYTDDIELSSLPRLPAQV